MNNNIDRTNWVPLPDDPDLLHRPGYDYGAKKIATTQAAQPSASEEIDLPIPALLKRMAHRIRHLFGEH